MLEREPDTIVVLVPGLWMPSWVMLPLARQLARAGYRSVRFGYASTRASLEENAARLAAFVRGLGKARVHLVGHSLGGVLALHTTARHHLTQVRRIVLAGSPYADSHAAHKLARVRLGRWMLGKTVPQWLACERPGIPADVEVGVIAGTVGFGLGMMVAPDLMRPHDGVVSVAETSIKGMAAYIELDVTHAGMLVSARVARRVCSFLRHGRFDDASSLALPVDGYVLDRRQGA